MSVQPPNSFQQAINIYTALGVPGELSFDGPIRSKSYILYSTGVPNIVGYAYTVTDNANPTPSANAPVAGTAKVGGTGTFAGILCNPKAYVANGTTAGGPLAPSLVLPDYSEGELLTMGELFVVLPGPANTGDLVSYDPLTGALNSFAPNTNFTASIAAGGSAGVADVMTVSAVSTGSLAVGQIVTGVGVEPATIISLGTGLGGTGTYNLSTINQQTVSSRAMTAANTPPPAFSCTAAIAATTMTVSAVASGQLRVGDQVFGTGVATDTVITALGSGVGGTGTYTVSQSQTVGSETMTGPLNVVVPNAVVGIFGAQSAGGVSSIKLTN